MLIRKFSNVFFMCVIVLMSQYVMALPPLPFSADYEVRFLTGFRAKANLTLKVPQANQYEMSSKANLKVLGKSVTKVDVSGEFILALQIGVLSALLIINHIKSKDQKCFFLILGRRE